MDPIVSTDWLAEQLREPDLRIVAAPFYMPGDGRLPQGEFEKVHIPGAVLFDLEQISDHANPLPHMLASPDDFAEAVGDLGISDADRIVVYDHDGLLSAGRVWWNFRAMGHDEVYVLDGGLPRWITEGRPVASGPVTTTPRSFTPVYRPALVRDLRQVEQALASGLQVIDARPRDRFQGTGPEPRAGVSSGHMPGARNTPHAELVENGALKSKAALAALFRGEGVDVDQPVITTCGSGVSAAIIALALARLGKWDAPVYDGSWTEWASRIGSAIAVGR
ncbi:MAG TPA: 3-mercaptopyruvate sulfurtransferase [Caulobacteraceae bacterium]|jgi:thiosulfate/3-mercaptopyruvate sulfurtransferase